MIPDGHHYSPVPDLDSLPDSLWSGPREAVGIDWNTTTQLDFLREVLPGFAAECASIPNGPTDCPYQFHFNNGMFSSADALALYAMVRHFKPRLVIEVGAGHTTRLIAQAALVNGSTDLISIEPYPDEVTKRGFPGLGQLVMEKVQNVSLDLFGRLKANDILFIDSSHVAKIGSDVVYLLLEVIPRLAPGVIVHVHDIFLPFEYPKQWVKELHFFWNEQYLLQAFLMFNREFEILLAIQYLNANHPDELRAAFPNVPVQNGVSLWMRRGRATTDSLVKL